MPGRIVATDPDQQRHRGAQVRVQNRRRGDVVRQVGVPAVEAVPAEPQQARSGGDHQQVVGSIDLAITLQPGSDHRRSDEARDTRGEVNHVSAGEVESAVLSEEAAAPDQEGVDRVDDARPHDHERNPGPEVDPAQDRSEHQDRGDRREDELEISQRRLREHDVSDERDVALLQQVIAVQDRPGLTPQVAEESVVGPEDVHRRTERELVGVEHPDDQHQGERDEGHHHRVHRPALLHHAAIEDDESGHAHQADQGRRCHLPSVVAWTQPIQIHSVVFSFLIKGRAGRPKHRNAPPRGTCPMAGGSVPGTGAVGTYRGPKIRERRSPPCRNHAWLGRETRAMSGNQA